jgi:hypothetical protein
MSPDRLGAGDWRQSDFAVLIGLSAVRRCGMSLKQVGIQSTVYF